MKALPLLVRKLWPWLKFFLQSRSNVKVKVTRSIFFCNGKVLSQGMYICNMKVLPLLVRKLWPRLKFFKSNSNVKTQMSRRGRAFIFHMYIPCQGHKVKNQWVFVKHYSMPPAATKLKKAKFSFKVKVKITRSLTLVSFERASLVEYACQIWSLYLLQFKSYSEG